MNCKDYMTKNFAQAVHCFSKIIIHRHMYLTIMFFNELFVVKCKDMVHKNIAISKVSDFPFKLLCRSFM